MPDTTHKTCLDCGTVYPAGDFGGMCPACLLRQLAADPGEGRPAGLPDLAGTRIGRYVLVAKIGEGGMGSVWKARQDEPIEREVALKLIKPGMDTRAVLERFETERQLLARLDHPHIAKVLDAGASELGRPYFVMELVPGIPITRFCEQEGLDIRQRLELFTEVCDAVAHAHEKAIIHRDLKPTNVLASRDPATSKPVVKVIDFGVAKATAPGGEGLSLVTLAGQIVGTPGYLSPEQAAAQEADVRSDVYSLGALLYEMLTGTAPFDVERLQQAALGELQRILREEDPPRPSTRVTRIDGKTRATVIEPGRLRGELDWIVMKAMEKDRNRRYSGPVAFADDIRRYFRHDPVSAVAPGLPYRIRKFCRKHRVPVAASAAIVLALVLGGALAAWQAARAARNAAAERQARLETLATLADAYTQAGLHAGEDRDYGIAQLWFEAAAGVAERADDLDRSHVNALRAALFERAAVVPVRTLPFTPYQSPQFSEIQAGGRFMIRHLGLHERPLDVQIIDIARETLCEFGTGESLLHAAAVDPGGKQAAVSRMPGTVEIRSLAGGELLHSISLPHAAAAARILALTYSADGNRLFIGTDPGFVWDLGKDALVAGPVPAKRLRHAAFSPAGDRLLTLADPDGPNWKVAVYDVSESTLEGPPAEPLFPPVNHRTHGSFFKFDLPRFTPEGDAILVLGQDGDQRPSRYDARTGRLLATIGGNFIPARLSPDGRLALGGNWTYDAATGALRHMARLGVASFTPDGASIGSIYGGIYDAETGALEQVLHPGAQFVEYTTNVTEDGALFVSEGAAWALQRPLPIRRIVDAASGFIAFSPDGRHFAPAGAPIPQTRFSGTRVYDLESGEPAGPRVGTEGWVMLSCDLAPGAPHIALACVPASHDFSNGTPAGGGEGQVQFWDWQTGTPLRDPVPMPTGPRSVRYHPSGEWLAVVCAGGEVMKVEVASGTASLLFKQSPSVRHYNNYEVNGAARFEERGKLLFVWGMNGETHAWDVPAGRPRFEALRFQFPSPRIDVRNGVLYVAGSGDQPPHLFYDAATGRPLDDGIGSNQNTGSGSRLSPDGRLLLWAGGANTLYPVQVGLWDWRAGRQVMRGIPADRNVGTLGEFVPGTPWIAVAGLKVSQEVGFFDRRSGRAVAPPLRFRHPVLDMAIAPGGSHLVVSSNQQNEILVVDLEAFFAPGPLADLSRSDRFLLAEINAAATIRDGTLCPLDRAAWLEKWADFRRRHPDFHRLRPAADELLRFHRNAAAMHPAGSFASQWHAGRAAELQDE